MSATANVVNSASVAVRAKFLIAVLIESNQRMGEPLIEGSGMDIVFGRGVAAYLENIGRPY
jgi:hypothetical protein